MEPIRCRIFLLCLVFSILPETAWAASPYRVYESHSDFETVLEGAKFAIQEQGFFINKIMHMGDMFRRTARDLGVRGQVYDRAESIEFCSARLSRKMIEENPARIVNCPFILSIYTLPDHEGMTFVAYRAIPENEVANSPIMAEIARTLREIAEAAIDW